MTSGVTKSWCVDNVHATNLIANFVYDILSWNMVDCYFTCHTHDLNTFARSLVFINSQCFLSLLFNLSFINNFVSKFIINLYAKQIVYERIYEGSFSGTTRPKYYKISVAFAWSVTCAISGVEYKLLFTISSQFDCNIFFIDCYCCSIERRNISFKCTFLFRLVKI